MKYLKRFSVIPIIMIMVLAGVFVAVGGDTINTDALPRVLVNDKGYVGVGTPVKDSVYGDNMETFKDSTNIVTGYFNAVLQSTTPTGVVSTASDVTEEMCNSAYWNAHAQGPTRILMSKSDIASLNDSIMATAGAHMIDLENMATGYDGDSLKSSLANEIKLDEYPYNKISHINNLAFADEAAKIAYFDAIKANITAAATTTSDSVKYAIASDRAEMYNLPTNDFIGYGADDTDDEKALGAAVLGEPLIVKITTADGKFAYCYSNNISGWIDTSKIAVCSSKDEWLDAWKVEEDGDDFLVVTTDKIILEDSFYDPATAAVELSMGSILKLVPEDQKPTSVAERGVWNTYVVYLPTRKADGSYEKKIALISQHYSVSRGFLDLTQANITDVAFECLGNRYGWGGSLHAMDCSFYTRYIYRCFGLELPRNTTWQQAVPGHMTDLSAMSDEEKYNYIRTLPAGSLLYFSGHTMVYLGNVDDKLYVISALGSVVPPDSSSVYSTMTVCLNSLDAKRGGNRGTWLHNLTAAVTYYNPVDISDELCEINIANAGNIVYTGNAITPNITVTDCETPLRKDIDYTMSVTNNVNAGEACVSVTGLGRYSGTATKNFTIKKASYSVAAAGYSGVYDGEAHTIFIDGIKAGSDIYFRIDPYGEWISELPERIDVGSTTVYYMISHPNYETISSYANIDILAEGEESSDYVIQYVGGESQENSTKETNAGDKTPGKDSTKDKDSESDKTNSETGEDATSGENTQVQSSSSNTGFVVTIVILSIGLAGAFGFIVYDKFIKK